MRKLAVAVVLVIAAACTRTPPEPAPPSTTNGPAITADRPSPPPTMTAPAPGASSTPPSGPGPAPGASGRCIASTPDVAPPIPAPASAEACPPDPEGIPKLKTAQVAFPDARDRPKVEVEIVTTDLEIQRGLMYRRSMAEDHGMLFRLGERREHTFWMHNTCIPLDMMFVDDDGMIVGIVESATPLTDTTRTVGCPSSWVLEVNAGWSRRHGVRAGQKMGIPAAAR